MFQEETIHLLSPHKSNVSCVMLSVFKRNELCVYMYIILYVCT